MKLFFIIPYVPSLVRVRPYQIIRHLKERGHAISLATIVTNQQEEDDLAHFRQYCDEVIVHRLPMYKSLINCAAAVPSKLPLQSMYCWHARLFAEISKKVFGQDGKPNYDIIHIEHLRGSQYGTRLLENKAFQHLLPPIVWDSVDSISYLFKQASQRSQQGLSRFITQFELHRTEIEEARLVSMFDQVLVTSPKDKAALEELAARGYSPIRVLPNGVDLEYFQPGDFSKRESATLVVSGKMSYHANVNMVLYLVNEILPIVWKHQPDVKLWIVGKDPSNDIQALADNPSITVTGYVESLLPYLQKASIAVAPIIYGAGIQNKVLEAMACATPVVTNPQAISAISAKPGRDVFVAGEPEDFAKVVLDLLGDAELRYQIGNAGRNFVEEFHDWKKICIHLEDIYNQQTNQR